MALAEGGRSTATGWRGVAARTSGTYHVGSVQRMLLPQGKTARWAVEEYTAWPPLLGTFIRAEGDAEGNVRIVLTCPRISLLEHHFARDRSRSSERQVLDITGSVLARKVEKATRRPRL